MYAKKIHLLWVAIFLSYPMVVFGTSDHTSELTTILDDEQEELSLDNSLKNFIVATVIHAQEVSPGLLHCYQRIMHDKNTVILNDLLEALPELLHQLALITKAPRPGTIPPLAGAPTCDLSVVTQLLHALLIRVNQCCGTSGGSCDSTGTFTLLHDLEATLTTCCQNITQEFQETWTILGDIATTLSTFDTSVVVFYNTTTLLVQTVITLTEIVDTLSGIVQDLSETTSLLHDINNTLTTCCANLNGNFQDTWTILSAGFNSTFSTINTIVNDANGTFSSLQDIQNTLTACCSTLNNDFQQTWTILGAGFNDTFSALATIMNDANGTFSSLQDIRNTLTVCCATLNNDFQQTWTILDSLRSTGCTNTPITQADVDAGGGVYSITTPGNYFLYEDIISAGAPLGYIIEINASNVTLDLCNRVITGSGGNSTSGIFVNTATNVTVRNGVIQDVLVTGVTVNGGSTDLLFDNVSTVSCGIHGFQFGSEPPILALSNTDPITNVRIINCSVLFCSQLFSTRNIAITYERMPLHRFTLTTFGGFYTFNCSNLMFDHCMFNNNLCADVYGLILLQCSNCTVLNCQMNDNQADQFSAGLTMFDAHDNYFANCTFNSNFGNGFTRFTVGGGTGVAMTDCTNNVFFNCQAASNAGESSVGFGSLGGANNYFDQCVATNNIGTTAESYGFSFESEAGAQVTSCDAIGNLGLFESAGFYAVTGTSNSFINCQAIDSQSTGTAAGFILRSELNSRIENCVMQDNTSTDSGAGISFGILLDADIAGLLPCAQCYINHNSLSNNTGGFASFGIMDIAVNASTSFVASNFAFNNGINYSVTYPSAMLPVVSGSFSGTLPATGTTGSFDNIDISL